MPAHAFLNGLRVQLKRDLLEYQSMVERQDDVLQVQRGLRVHSEGIASAEVAWCGFFSFDQPISFPLGLTDPPLC